MILYVGKAKSTGGHNSKAKSSDVILIVRITTPKELGGTGGLGTNPEQLFAAGYSACFITNYPKTTGVKGGARSTN